AGSNCWRDAGSIRSEHTRVCDTANAVRTRKSGPLCSPLSRLDRSTTRRVCSVKWVTRERPKTDRIACPWLIRHFIDREAEFLYVPADQVLATAEAEGAISYDAPGARYDHPDGLCTFEAPLQGHR